LMKIMHSLLSSMSLSLFCNQSSCSLFASSSL
jgi:hypothetical protein